MLGYATLTKPFQGLTKVDIPESLPWTEETEQAFVDLKQTLSTAPALGPPDYSKPFVLYCHEKGYFVQAVLSQKHGDQHQPIANFFTTLGPVAAPLPPCLKAATAAAMPVENHHHQS